jgi:Na+-driven multidrug efflux pump
MLFGVLAWGALPAIFRWLGGSGDALHQALVFSHVWFSGAIVLLIQPFLSALLRGAGNARTPSRIGVLVSLLYIPLLAVLVLGIGGWPGLGLVGGAIAPLISGAVAAVLLAYAIAGGGLGFTPGLKGVRLQPQLLVEILRVGAMGSVTTLTATVTAMAVTSLVGRFGTAALAGYGVGMRLEFMVAPLAFGVGTGATTLVGIAAGAHDWRRAVQIAWVAGMTAFFLIGGIGGVIALMPQAWSHLFVAQPDVVAVSVACIVTVAPFYCLFGLGLTLNFACQGAGRMAVPMAASIARMVIAAGGGWFAIEGLSLGLGGVFAAIAASLIVYGGSIAGALLVAPWRAKA